MSNTDIATIKEESRELDHMKPTRLTDSLFSKDLAPHYMKLAGQLAASEIVPKCYRNRPSDLFICWAKGYQLGIPPEQAMDCIAVVNGKAVMWGDEMLALCMTHPDFEDITEVPIHAQNGSVFGYICTVKRKGRTPVASEFNLDMAKKAGLLAKGGVWNQYPERMLKLRARGFALRDAFPDALKGIKSREEVEDYIDAEYTVSKPSRTETVKRELLNQGASNADAMFGMAIAPENKVVVEADDAHQVQQSVEEALLQESGLHQQIKQLIAETGFTEEQLRKAMKFYKVESIEQMDKESCEHFILKLTK